MEAERSQFLFLGYKVDKCTFEIKETPDEATLSFNVGCGGNFDETEKIFTLRMSLNVKDPTEQFILNLESEAKFSYTGSDKNMLKSFIGRNAPAILYPYLRSYVTMLTINASIEPIVLPTLNLQSVGMKLANELIKED